MTRHTVDTITSDALDALYAEIDRLTAELSDYDTRVGQLEDILSIAHETSNRSEAERAKVQRDRDQHAAVLAEVLRSFRHETHPGRRCLQSDHVPVEEVERWRSVVAPTVERPWWQQVAETRADLERAEAALARVQALADEHPAGIDTALIHEALDTGAAGHRYLSTGCLHGEHSYCQSKTGQAGTKTPAQRKWCAAPCICPCHRGNATVLEEQRPT